jgi:glycosyltransferase involved in cell wall biosynthesis
MPTAAVDAHKQLRLPVVQTILGTPRAPVTPAADWAILTTDGAPTILDGSTPTWIPCMTIETTSNHRPHRSASSGPIRLLFVGRIVHSKGLDLLLRALRSVPGVELTVVGDGPDLVERKLQAASLGGRVAFTGSLDRSAVFDEIAHGDVLVVPSRGDGVEFQEGMPTVIAEALSLNCPVLGTAVGGVRRVLDGPNAPGWLVPADDAEALSRQIAALTAQNIAERGAGARDVYEHLLRPDVVLGAYEDCYARAVSQAR